MTTQTPKIREAIQSILMKYHENHFVENNGNCLEIALEVLENLPDTIASKAQEMMPPFLCHPEEDGGGIDFELFEKHWSSWEFPFSKEDMAQTDFFYISHAFVEAEKYCYDAEVPEGVSNLFEMPFFRRAIYGNLLDAGKVEDFSTRYPEYMERAKKDYEKLELFCENTDEKTRSSFSPIAPGGL